jgi:S-layer protein
MSVLNQTKISALYAAVFSRAPDKAGLDFWMTQAAQNPTTVFTTIANGFSQHPVFTQVYGSLSGSAYVNALYTNILGGAGDAAGVTFWTNQLASGQTKAQVLAAFVQSSLETDLTKLNLSAADFAAATIRQQTITNKATVGVQFATSLGNASNLASGTNPSNLASLQADPAYQASVAVIANVTSNPFTASQAFSNIASAVASGNPIAFLSGSGSGAVTGQTFTLTTSIDTVAGTSGNDTFVALQTGGTDETLSIADTIIGGAGTDTLNITLAEAAILNYATVSGVENISIRSTVTQGASVVANAVDMDNFVGVTSLTADRTVGENNISNIALTTALTARNLAASADQTFTWKAAGVTGTADAATVTLAGAASGADIELAGAIEAVTLNVTAATSLAELVLDAGTTSLTVNAGANLTVATTFTNAEVASLTITGSGNVSLPTLDASTKTVSAASATGNLTLVAGDVADATNPSTVDIADITINTGSGADNVSLVNVNSDREIALNTGAGNDVITIGSVLVTSSATNAGDVINGGDGTDTLVGTSAILDDFTTAITTVSSIEVLRVSDALIGAITPANIQTGLNTVTLAAGANAGTINFAAGANVVNIAASNAGQLTLNDTGTATTDSVTINNTATAADDMGDGNALVVGGLETVNIVSTNATGTTSQDFGAITITADTGGTATLNLSGTNAVTTGAITARVVNASGLTAKATGTATFTMGAALVGGTTNTITGSAGDDILVGDANDTTNIDGGAGNDTITGGSDAETIRGGAGNDIINGGGGADMIFGDAGNDEITLNGTAATVDAGDGDDTVIAAGNLLFGSAVIGGAGIDTLSTNAAVSAANGSTVSGFEILTLATSDTTDLDNFANNVFTTVNLSTAAGAQAVQSVRSEVIQITGALNNADATITMQDATGAADSITIRVSSAGAVDTTHHVLVAGVETINLVMNDTNTTAHQNTFDLGADSATTINVSGNAGVIFATGGNTDIADVITMNASGVVLSAVTAAGVTYAATYNAVGGVTTITGSNGVDVLTGGANTNDTINGGAGADTLVYTGGSDVLTGGAGNDVFDINADGTSTAFVTIADITAGDTIDLAGVATGTIADVSAANWALAKVTLGSAATFANYLAAAADQNGSTNSLIEWFTFGGDTYIVVSNDDGSTGFTSGTDTLVKLTGTLDISGSSVTGAVITIA